MFEFCFGSHSNGVTTFGGFESSMLKPAVRLSLQMQTFLQQKLPTSVATAQTKPDAQYSLVSASPSPLSEHSAVQVEIEPGLAREFDRVEHRPPGVRPYRDRSAEMTARSRSASGNTPIGR